LNAVHRQYTVAKHQVASPMNPKIIINVQTTRSRALALFFAFSASAADVFEWLLLVVLVGDPLVALGSRRCATSDLASVATFAGSDGAGDGAGAGAGLGGGAAAEGFAGFDSTTGGAGLVTGGGGGLSTVTAAGGVC